MRSATALGTPSRVSIASRVVVAPRIRLDAAAHPFRRAGQSVEVGVTDDRIDRADALHQLGIDHLRTCAVLGLGRQHEARVVAVTRVLLVIVMVDPSAQPVAELLDEGQRHLVESAAAAGSRERDVQNGHAARKIFHFRQLARRSES